MITKILCKIIGLLGFWGLGELPSLQLTYALKIAGWKTISLCGKAARLGAHSWLQGVYTKKHGPEKNNVSGFMQNPCIEVSHFWDSNALNTVK